METTLENSSTEQLNQLIAHYPWFTTARMVLSQRTGEVDPRLTLRLGLCGTPALLLRQPSPTDFLQGNTVELIDHFLTLADVRIRPPETPDNKDISIDSIAEDPDLVSEELAEIFRKQGLNDKAKEVYRKLSLLYPEKSVYFAGIIAEL